jgi:AraC-like DNA-binding protein
MENLFYLEEHKSCYKYKSDYESGFKFMNLKSGASIKTMNTSYNHLMFLREGLMNIRCNENLHCHLQQEECILIPRSETMSCEILQDAALMVMNFDVLHSICDKAMLHLYRPHVSSTKFSFTPVPIRYPMSAFLDLLETYLDGGIECEHLHEIKQKEFFLVLRRCYSKDEILNLLHPIIGISDFKNFILRNYQRVDNVGDLADMSGMGRTAFDCKFRDVFGMSTRQWMLKRTAAHIRHKIMDPEVTIKDIMNEFKFNSATHFNRFCKQQFNCTPGELLKRSRIRK